MRIKLLAFTAMCLLLSVCISAQSKWDGEGDNLSWNDPLNWVGDVIPGATDDVLLDNSIVPADYNVQLPSGATTVVIRSLTITPGTGKNISLQLPASNTAITTLQITFAGNAMTLGTGASLINSSSGNIDIGGNVSLAAGSLIDISTGSVDNVLGIKGDLSVSGTITETGTSSFSAVSLNGTTKQDITVSGSGSITGNRLDFQLDNAAGAELLSNLLLPYSYTILTGNITLDDFSLTTPTVNLGGPMVPPPPVATNHVITNGAGFLIIPNIGASIVIFPVGVDATTVNQVEISNGSGLTYSVRVEPGVNPAISLPLYAIDRTWIINTNSPAANPVAANITFYYFTGQGKANFDYTSTVDIGQYLPGAWNILQNNLPPSSFPPEYRAFTSINSFNTRFIVGNHGAILPIDFSIVCKVQKNNGAARVGWDIGSGENVSHFDIEKSVNGSGFKALASVMPDEKSLSYFFKDNDLQDGYSLYRVKVILNNGKFRYSNTVALLQNNKIMLITAVAPNPARHAVRVTISAPEKVEVRLLLYDAQGRLVRQWQQKIADGTTVVPLQLDGLVNGIYLLSGSAGNIKMNVTRIVKQ